MILLRKKYSVSDAEVDTMQMDDYQEQANSLNSEMEKASRNEADKSRK